VTNLVKLTKNGVLSVHFRDSTDNLSRLICNFKCSYCIINNLKIKERRFNKEDFQQTKFIWDLLSKIEDSIHVRINFHGEIFADKWAKECGFYINKISNVKVFEIITNNSINPKKYMDKLDLVKSSFNCSYHPEFITLENFINNCNILKKAGCEVFANMVCTPQIISKIPKIYNRFEKSDIELKLQAFQTHGFKYLEKQYPKDYTIKERKILKKYFDCKEGYEYSVERKRTKGLDCYAGVNMINIFLNGAVRRCFTGALGSYSKKKSKLKSMIPEKVRDKINLFLGGKIEKNFLRQVRGYIPMDHHLQDLISGKIRLEMNPYPCHENYCHPYAHFMHLKEFVGKYPPSERFIDNYELTK